MRTAIIGLPHDRQALEGLASSDALLLLDALIGAFNIFDAVGVARQELRHSDFLAFLLDPRRSHGLGDAFLRAFLRAAAPDEGVAPSGALAAGDWNDSVVEREWQNIDILIRSENQRCLAVIENKVMTGEHSGQLGKYGRAVARHYPGWNVLYLYLTLEQELPSDARYRPLGYRQVAQVIEALLTDPANQPKDEVRLLLSHYVQMLRRNFLGDSDVERLCREIYREHKRALDLLFAYRPDRAVEVRTVMEHLISSTGGLVLDYATEKSKKYISFAPLAWDARLPHAAGHSWSAQGRMLCFWFENQPDHLTLSLQIGPGPREVRERLFAMAKRHTPPFQPDTSLASKYGVIYRFPLLSPPDYLDADGEALTELLQRRWQVFLENDFISLCTVMDQEWNAPNNEDGGG